MRDLSTGDFARNVEGDQQSEAPSGHSTSTTNTGASNNTQGTNQGSSSAQSSSSHSTQEYVRKVSVFHIGEPPQEYPERFDLSAADEELEIEYFE